MCKPTRTLDDCIADAKAALIEPLDGGANYLRRYGADIAVSDNLHHAADGAVPAHANVLIEVFGSDCNLWYSDPASGLSKNDGVIGAMSRVVFDAIAGALADWVSELEDDPLVCEADECESDDDHAVCPNETHCGACDAEGEVRCTSHCGGAGACERCAVALIEEAKQ